MYTVATVIAIFIAHSVCLTATAEIPNVQPPTPEIIEASGMAPAPMPIDENLMDDMLKMGVAPPPPPSNGDENGQPKPPNGIMPDAADLKPDASGYYGYNPYYRPPYYPPHYGNYYYNRPYYNPYYQSYYQSPYYGSYYNNRNPYGSYYNPYRRPYTYY